MTSFDSIPWFSAKIRKRLGPENPLRWWSGVQFELKMMAEASDVEVVGGVEDEHKVNGAGRHEDQHPQEARQDEQVKIVST